MPRGDGTGPMGCGPMTGRRMGHCAGSHTPGYVNRGWGYGRGSAGWWASRWMDVPPAWAAPPDREQQLDWLRTQARNLEEALKRLRDTIERLEKEE